METEPEYFVVGQAKIRLSNSEMAALFKGSALENFVSFGDVKFSFGEAMTIGTLWEAENEWIFHRDGGPRADCLELARELSRVFEKNQIWHRFEVYGEADDSDFIARFGSSDATPNG